jgi:hypothetical protein
MKVMLGSCAALLALMAPAATAAGKPPRDTTPR